MAGEGREMDGSARLGIIERDRLIAELQAELFSRRLRDALEPIEVSERTVDAETQKRAAVAVATSDNVSDDERALLAAAFSSQVREIDLLRSMLSSLIAERGHDATAFEEFRRRIAECDGDSARAAISRAYAMTLRAVRRRVTALMSFRRP